MKILFLGDVAAAPGRKAVKQYLPELKSELSLDVVVVNGENAAHGRGINEETATELFTSGADVITLGDHTFDQKGVEELLATHARPQSMGGGRLLRPANYPSGTVGTGTTIYKLSNGQRLGVISLQGRVFMRQQVEDPVRLSRELMKEFRLGDTVDALVIDVHAEATSEKCVLGHVWDGKASLVVGTHTHIPTSDTRILPGGTAFQADAGMCGFYESSLGMSYESVLPTFERIGRFAFQPATGPATVSGVFVETDDKTGLAVQVRPIRRGGTLSQS